MTQTSYYWGGTTVGDATLAPYSDDVFSDLWRVLFTTDRTVECVLRKYWNELQVTNPAAATVRVREGAALVDGKLFWNTANVDLAVAVPGAGTNYYRVVLRKSWVAQTVRIDLLGPNPASPPAVTQIDGTTWEVSLATVAVASSGLITITDTREFIHHAQTVETDNIEDASITQAKLAFSLTESNLIYSTVINAAGSVVDWTGIPQTFNNLVIVAAARATASGGGLVEADFRIQFNGDAAANHYRSITNQFGPNSVGDVQSGYFSGLTTSLTATGGITPGNAAAGKFGFAIMNIPAYSSTVMRKLLEFHNGSESTSWFNHSLGFGYWTGTAAINRIRMQTSYNGGSGNYGFAVGSSFQLYGLG